MADRALADDGSIADIPWASVFDPAINMRALSAVQARGFRAATEVVDRLIRFIDGNGVITGGQHDAGSLSGPSDVDRLLGAWESLAERLSTSLRGAGATPIGAAALDFGKTDMKGVVYLEVAGSGRASTEVWLHNGGPDDLGQIGLRCSDLLAHHGGLVPADEVMLAPDRVAVPPRSSRGVCCNIEVRRGQPAGTYRGTLMADGYPDVWLPVVLHVLADSP